MKRLISRLKELNALRKRQWALHAYSTLIKDPHSGMEEIMRRGAFRMAIDMLMKMMDQEGLIHCGMCPTRAPLQKVNGILFCEGHAKQQEAQTKEAVA